MSMKTVVRLAAIGLFTSFSVYVAGCFAPADSQQEEADESVAQTDQGLTLICGGPGEVCCSGLQSCNVGLRCNENNICRKPCGNVGERCCSGSTCTLGICDTSTNTCKTAINPSGSSSGGPTGGSSSSSSSSSGAVPQCTSSLQCPINYACVNAQCVEMSPTTGPCTSDLQCSGGQVCRNGYCCTIDGNDPNNSFCPLVPPYYN